VSLLTLLDTDDYGQFIFDTVLMVLYAAKVVASFYRAMLAQSAVMRLHVVRPSVCLSVCDDQVPCSNTFEFFENNFTAK